MNAMDIQLILLITEFWDLEAFKSFLQIPETQLLYHYAMMLTQVYSYYGLNRVAFSL